MMMNREELVRESLALEAEFLDELGAAKEAARVRKRVPKASESAAAGHLGLIRGVLEHATPSNHWWVGDAVFRNYIDHLAPTPEQNLILRAKFDGGVSVTARPESDDVVWTDGGPGRIAHR